MAVVSIAADLTVAAGTFVNVTINLLNTWNWTVTVSKNVNM